MQLGYGDGGATVVAWSRAGMAARAPVADIGRMKKELWLRLKRYHFDALVPAHLMDHVTAAFGGADASTKAFGSKLARKLGWTTAFSLRAIGEYKKFVYLGVASEISVTPSRVIDQVWHEHLLFSRAYRDFCRDVLGREFDHHPELVPTTDQTEVFQAQYEATLDLYVAEFNTHPPVDIWGTPKFSTSGGRNAGRTPRKNAGDGGSSSSNDDAPLYLLFDGNSDVGGDAHQAMPEFGGGGAFAGGGGGSAWSGDSTSHGHADAAATGHSDDAGSGDSGDGGGSGCSSSCGGGGCSS